MLSFTPRFSEVIRVSVKIRQPFNGFLKKTVETVPG